MAELSVDLPSVTCVLSSASACDELQHVFVGRVCRVSAREVLIVDAPDAPGAADAVPRAGLDEAQAVVEDVSDGWVRLVLDGSDAGEAFARLSELRLPDSGWIQGEVSRAPAKVRVAPGRIELLVPAPLAAHVEQRIRADAAEVLTP